MLNWNIEVFNFLEGFELFIIKTKVKKIYYIYYFLSFLYVLFTIILFFI